MVVQAQVSRVWGVNSLSVQAQVSRVRGSFPGAVQAQVSRVRGSLSGAMSVYPGLGGMANPFDECILSAVVTTTGITADSWTWQQVIIGAEPTVALIGSGSSRRYIAPATFDGCALTFQVTADKAGSIDSSAIVRHNIKPHIWDWRLDAQGNWIGVPAHRIPQSIFDSLNDNPLQFGSLQTSRSNRISEVVGGETAAMMEIFWDRWESNTTPGVWSASQIASDVAYLADLRSAGFTHITLGLGLHYAPTELEAAGTKFVNGTGALSVGLDFVWSAANRARAETYMAKVNASFPGGLNAFDAIRVTSGGRSEVLYPKEGSPTSVYDWWLYSPAAQSGTGIASGMASVPSPWVGWQTGSALPSGQTNVAPLLDWYINSLALTVRWQQSALTALGYSNDFMAVMPGSGTRPTTWDTLRAGTTLPSNNLASVGAVWNTIAASLGTGPYATRSYIHCSSLADNSGSDTPPAPGDDAIAVTTPNSWGSARWMNRLALEYDLKLSAENPGFGDVSDYQTTMLADIFAILKAGRFKIFHFAHSGQLRDGLFPEMADYTAAIMNYRTSQLSPLAYGGSAYGTAPYGAVSP